MTYKSYNIEKVGRSGPFTYEFWHEDYDGPEDKRCGFAPTEEDAKRQIDEQIEETN